MTNVVPFKKLSIKQGSKTQYLVILKKIYRKNTNCRVAMTTTYLSTSCTSEHLAACS